MARSLFSTTFHRDGTVTVWDVFTQQWLRTRRPSDRIIASLNTKERERVIKHCGLAASAHQPQEGP